MYSLFHSKSGHVLTTVAFVCLLSSCSTKTDVRPLADLNALKGRWAGIDNTGNTTGYEIDIDPATQVAKFTKVDPYNIYYFTVGEIALKNIEAVDATTYRGETKYRFNLGFYYFADTKLTIVNNELTTVSDSDRISGTSNITGQTTKYKRIQ